MTIWVDAQLSPRTAHWISDKFGFQARPLRDLGLKDAEDFAIFQAAKDADAIILTKDSDFVHLLERYGSPPRILWLTCGNTSEAALQQILDKHLLVAVSLFDAGEKLVEIGAP
jgi:predicted nuclease of predicted toxin-antitoxin system